MLAEFFVTHSTKVYSRMFTTHVVDTVEHKLLMKVTHDYNSQALYVS